MSLSSHQSSPSKSVAHLYPIETWDRARPVSPMACPRVAHPAVWAAEDHRALDGQDGETQQGGGLYPGTHRDKVLVQVRLAGSGLRAVRGGAATLPQAGER